MVQVMKNGRYVLLKSIKTIKKAQAAPQERRMLLPSTQPLAQFAQYPLKFTESQEKERSILLSLPSDFGSDT